MVGRDMGKRAQHGPRGKSRSNRESLAKISSWSKADLVGRDMGKEKKRPARAKGKVQV